MNLGNAIKLCRTQRNMSQADLAKLSEMSISYLSLLERGKRDPAFSTVEKIAKALDVPISILVFLAADKDKLTELSPETAEKLSLLALNLIEVSHHGANLHR